jgi:peptidase E
MRAILMSCNNCNEDYAYSEVSKYIQPGMKVLCVPFASELHWQLQGDYTEYKERHFNVFKSFGISEEDIDVAKITDRKDDLIDKFVESDIIFFSGGFMENIMYLIKTLDLGIIMDFIKYTKLIMGESAGALVLQDKYIEVPYIEDAYTEYREKDGLGFISCYNLIVHYGKYNGKHHENKEYIKNLNNKITVCLTDKSLIVYDNGYATILGDYEL